MPAETPIQRRITTDRRTSRVSPSMGLGYASLAGAVLLALIAIVLVAFGAAPALALLLLAVPLAIFGLSSVRHGRPRGTA